MTCIIQERCNRFYLTTSGNWSSDLNEAREFPSLHETIAHQRDLLVRDTTILVFRGKLIYRLEQNMMVPVCPALVNELGPEARPFEIR